MFTCPFYRPFSSVTCRSRGGNEWSWGGDGTTSDGGRGRPGLGSARVGATGGLESLGGLSITGSSHPGDSGRQAGGSFKGRGTIIRGPAVGARTRPASLSSITGNGPGGGTPVNTVANTAADTQTQNLPCTMHVRSLSLDGGEHYLSEDEDTLVDTDDDTDDGFVPQTHDVIISEIEEINLQDYMAKLEAPVFDEQAALADEFFGFGAGAFIRAAGGDDEQGGEESVNPSMSDTEMSGPESDSERGASGVSQVSSPTHVGSLEDFPILQMASDVAPKPETAGRAGRRGWSRQGSRGGMGFAGVSSDASSNLEERPSMAGLDDVDCAPGGADADDPHEFAGINADIYDDSDDDSWGEKRHALSLVHGGPGEMSDDGDDAEGITDANRGRENRTDADAGEFGESGPGGAHVSNGVASERFGFGEHDLGVDATEIESVPSPSRVRRRPVDDDFVVMSTPKGLRRVPSARKIRSSQGARPAVNGHGSNSHESANAPINGIGSNRDATVVAAGGRRQKPIRASSASGARASSETTRRLEMLQRPPSRQRPPPEAVDLFARGRAAAAAAAAAPAVPGLNKVSRPPGMAASMLRT